jgi:hypothetical protein
VNLPKLVNIATTVGNCLQYQNSMYSWFLPNQGVAELIRTHRVRTRTRKRTSEMVLNFLSGVEREGSARVFAEIGASRKRSANSVCQSSAKDSNHSSHGRKGWWLFDLFFCFVWSETRSENVCDHADELVDEHDLRSQAFAARCRRSRRS